MTVKKASDPGPFRPIEQACQRNFRVAKACRLCRKSAPVLLLRSYFTSDAVDLNTPRLAVLHYFGLEGVMCGGSERFRSLEAQLLKAHTRDLLGHSIWVRMMHQMLGSGRE